jgi:folate-dependent phosphoribosylglycinamide formyltransferase PurN
MVFVGGGALLSHAVGCSVALGLSVDAVCCPQADPAVPRLKRLGVTLLESENPTAALSHVLASGHGDIVFSINNRFILSDALLASGARFFNIHNGLVQRYRGVAEVCAFAALCNAEKIYGATLHRILPGQKVDSGPVVAQIEFAVGAEDDFATLFKNGLNACQRVFEQNVKAVVDGLFEARQVELAGKAYSYNDVWRLCAETEPSRLRKACQLGPFRAFFPVLSQRTALAAQNAIE